MKKTAYSAAYQAWFSRYESERLSQKKRRGARLVGFPDPPASPETIAATIDRIGASRVIEVLQVHRSTVARWLTGATVIPRAAWLLLILMADGRLPGMSEDWRDFRFVGDALHLIGSNQYYTAREIAGWHYQHAHALALSREIDRLRSENAHLLAIGDFDAANDPIIMVR